MQILSPVRDLRGRVEQAKMARRLAWGPGRARGVVPYLQPRAHKCILTDASESQARRVHEGLSHIALARERTYLPYVMHKHGRSTIPDTYAARAYTHNRQERWVYERRDEENGGRRPLHCFMNIICTIAPCSP